MAKENKNVTANNASENDAINVKEVTEMNKTQETTVTENNVQQEQQLPTEQTATQVPAEEPAKESFGKKLLNGAKKVGKWVGLGALLIGTAIVGEKIGEAVGFDKASANYDKLTGGDSSGDDPEDELTIDIGESDPIDVE